MTTLTFLVNGMGTENISAKAWVTIEQKANGMLLFQVKQVGGSMGSLRGIYFDIIDNEIVNTLRVEAADNRIMVESINCLRNGTDMNETYELEHKGNMQRSAIGKQSVVNSYGFILSSKARGLTLSDFSRIQLDDSSRQTNDDQSDRWLYLELI